MLKCPECKAEISTRTEVCPLCHTELLGSGNNATEIKKTELAYPKRGRLSPFSGNLFDKIYLGIWLTASIVALMSELIITKHARFSWIGISFALYLYLVFRITLRGGGSHFPQKITFHAVLITVAICSLNVVLPNPIIIFEFVLPSVYLASLIAICVFISVNYKRPEQYLLNIISIGLISALPFLVVTVTSKPVNTVMATVTLSLGIAAIIGVIIFKARHVYAELKRKFHI